MYHPVLTTEVPEAETVTPSTALWTWGSCPVSEVELLRSDFYETPVSKPQLWTIETASWPYYKRFQLWWIICVATNSACNVHRVVHEANLPCGPGWLQDLLLKMSDWKKLWCSSSHLWWGRHWKSSDWKRPWGKWEQSWSNCPNGYSRKRPGQFYSSLEYSTLTPDLNVTCHWALVEWLNANLTPKLEGVPKRVHSVLKHQ